MYIPISRWRLHRMQNSGSYAQRYILKQLNKRTKMKSQNSKVISYSNFNPVALFSVILLAIGLILGSVSIGIGQWSRLETDRNDGEVMDGATVKTLGLLSRCVSYTLTTEVLSLGLSQEDQPQGGCISVSDVNCSMARSPLISALDVFSHSELHNSHNREACNRMKSNLSAAAAFLIVAIVTTFLSMLLYFPLWHWLVFVAGAVSAILSVLFYAIALAAYVDLDQDFAGFFSLNGRRHEACLSYGFGIALAAFLINTIATAIGFVAVCYHRLCPKPYRYSGR